ncbi:MAG: ATP-binding protein [Bacteroidetes bacterium]|nr:ATP-binding protein [Bacteroidota bacterium]
MENKICILHLEDQLADSILVKAEIKKGFDSFDYHFADSAAAFIKALEEKKIDIVLSDYELPDYSGTDALALVKSRYSEVPFIFVSGVMGEDAAIASLLNGAVDYVFKTKLQRLVPAIKRALHEAALLREKNLAENERRKLSRAVEQSSVSIVITDRDGNIEFVNPWACETAGYSREELLGKNPRVLQSGEVPYIVYKDLWDTISAGNQWHGEFHNRKKTGELYWESVAISPVFDAGGSITHYVAIKEDVTGKKAMISELKAAKERAEASDRLKTEFISSISHEIRTPLNGILGMYQVLLDDSLSQEEKEEYFAILQSSSDRLIKTVTNYMDTALIVSGNLAVKETVFAPEKLLIEMGDQFRPAFAAAGLVMELLLPPDAGSYHVKSDAEMLRKVFSHLIGNAIEFTSRGTVSFGFEKKEGTLDFFVKDTGTGIDPEVQATIFEHFVQEDGSLTRGHEGSGLGLSITRGLLKLMGAEIRLESEKNKGSAFYFSLPVVS